MAAMTRHGTIKLKIKEEGFEIELERESVYASTSTQPASTYEETRSQKIDIPPSFGSPLPHKEELNGKFVNSPMVGTFYNTPAPDEPAFVKPGDTVEADTVVCIIEAMKVMNEVKAGISGKVTEVLVDNGHPVEFGTKLFRIT